MKKILFLFALLFFFQTYIKAQTSSEKDFEKKIMSQLDGYDPIIGIYLLQGHIEKYIGGNFVKSDKVPNSNIKVAIVRQDRLFRQYAITSQVEGNDYETITPTSTKGTYMRKGQSFTYNSRGNLEWCTYETAENIAEIANTTVKEVNRLNIEIKLCTEYIKLFPTQWDLEQAVKAIEKKQPSSGTGFAISNNGIIATNYHVIDGAESIKIRGINGDFHKTYNAKVLVSDKTNDLALLQIDDLGFTSIGTTPYVINTKLSTVGEGIFVLGYPLRASMGDEIKLTNGIISSKTGFQGEISSYQISAPVQPGNSGGPLFDSQGNLIGIVNAKHLEAENATYAVKSNYLTNLIDLLDNPPLLASVNALNGKTLSQQVQLINKFVYIIEIN